MMTESESVALPLGESPMMDTYRLPIISSNMRTIMVEAEGFEPPTLCL